MSEWRQDVCVDARNAEGHRGPKTKLRWRVLVLALAVSPMGTAEALELRVIGRATVRIPPELVRREIARQPTDFRAVREEALREAKRDGVRNAIKRVLCAKKFPEPDLVSQVDGLLGQVRDGQVEKKLERAEDAYQATVTLTLDDLEFNTSLLNAGIAPPPRAHAILVVMDEFLAAQGDVPQKIPQTYNAFVGQLQGYDLRIIDNSLFRSRYFKGRPLTIEQMENGEELSKYAAFAKRDAKADFLMVGTSIIKDEGKNPHTGDDQCGGTVTVRTYSTVDAEVIASETFAESAAGSNPSDCAAVVAKKLAGVGGPIIGARLRNYWKQRCTYGGEYVITLSGASLQQSAKLAFTNTLRATSGVESLNLRTSGPTQLQYTVTYKGTDPLDQALAMALFHNPDFSKLDSLVDGNQIQLCIGPCASRITP